MVVEWNKYPDSESFGASQVSIHMGSSGHGSSSDLWEWVSTKIHQSWRAVFGKITYQPLSEALIRCHATWRTLQSRKIKARLASHLKRLQQLWEIDLYWRDASCTSRKNGTTMLVHEVNANSINMSVYNRRILYKGKMSSLNFSTEFVLWQNSLSWFQTCLHCTGFPLLEGWGGLTEA